MTATDGFRDFDRFFDSVLSEIAFGRVDQGIGLLAGMLDALHLQGKDLIPACKALGQHMLHMMLLDEPVYRHACQQPGQVAALIEIASQRPDALRLRPVGHRLFKATSQLTIVRALCQRRATAYQRLESGWRAGRSITTIGIGGTSWLQPLSGNDMSGVTCIDGSFDPNQTCEMINSQAAPADLICAPYLLDTVDAADIAALFASLRCLLSPQGILLLSTLIPDHAGSGWRRACLHWEPFAHDDQALRDAASEAGLSTQMLRDESDCFTWVSVRRG